MKCPICLDKIRSSELSSHYEKELKLYENSIESFLPNQRKRKSVSYSSKASSSIRKNTNIFKQVQKIDRNFSKQRLNRTKRNKLFISNFNIDSSNTTISRTYISSGSGNRPLTLTTHSSRDHNTKSIHHIPSQDGGAGDDDDDFPIPLEANPICPICSSVLPLDDESVNLHVDMCLNNLQVNPPLEQQLQGGKEENVIVDSHKPIHSNQASISPDKSSTTWEEYTWAGKTRIRATALIESNLSSTSGYSIHKKTDEEIEEEIDIDNDDEPVFGQPQFSERDLAPYSLEETIYNKLSSNETNHIPLKLEEDVVLPENEYVSQKSWILTGDNNIPADSKLIINSLKSKIKSLEKNASQSACLICMDPYTNPVVSTLCWHVHCEKCWLQTLAAKKLCPQCQKITCAADLRKIYL